MKRILYPLICILILSCGKEEPNLTVTGKITGLKKGTLYLERIQDTTLIVIDSMVVNGEPEFLLKAKIDEPEVLHISLNSNSEEFPRIAFFADEGITTINTTLKRFYHDAKIDGSKQQKLLNDYYTNKKKYSDKNLELIKAEFEAQNDAAKLDSIRKVSSNLLKSRYLYAVNFAMNNKDSEVAPYIALTEVYDANIKYLDTLYNVLEDNIALSKYGKQLSEFIAERKIKDNN